MLALKLTDTRDFMNKLLKNGLFDHFLLQEAVITTAAAYTIDGRVNREFFSDEEREELGIADCRFLPFSLLRDQVFRLIQGKKEPTFFKFLFLLSPENLARTLESISSSYTAQDITGMFLNLRYQDRRLSLTTGVSYSIFSTDKTLEGEWDRMVRQFLKKNEISYEEL